MRTSTFAKPSLMFAMAGLAMPAHATTLLVDYSPSFGSGTPITIGSATSPQFTFSSINLGTPTLPIAKNYINANGSSTIAFSGGPSGSASLPAFNGMYDITFDIGTTSYFGDLVVDGNDDHISQIDFSPTNSAVPEPASWAMMLLGLGAVGAAVRSRRQSDGAAIA